ncbi:PP2C family protein-serine/threonine phosphatase [Streptomyces sp. NPDC055709]
MSEPEAGGEAPRRAVDYEAVFRASPGPALLLTPGLVIVDANQALLTLSRRGRDEFVGRSVFDVFPTNPADQEAPGTRLRASVDRVLATGEPDSMALQRYDFAMPSEAVEKRYWSPVNAPVLGPDGQVVLIISRVDDVTDMVRAHTALQESEEALSDEESTTAALLARFQGLQELNEQLRRAHRRDREIAVGLQRAMLPTAPLGHSNVAVRYRPATSALNVCGDWYDFIDVPPDRLMVAVGDVVGHGLEAASLMGQLRSALSTAIRATGQPATALKALALYALTVEGALATTAVQTVIDQRARTITYSRAGHPPPMLLRPDGRTVDVLDEAADPPLGALDDDSARSEATHSYEPGATLVLYTDGLIERREEDIDAGLERLARSLARHGGLAPESLADALLVDLSPAADGPDDDTALVVVRL